MVFVVVVVVVVCVVVVVVVVVIIHCLYSVMFYQITVHSDSTVQYCSHSL